MDAHTLAGSHNVASLCGFKTDLDPEHKVTFLEAFHFAQENELIFLDIRVCPRENMEEAFLKCARTIQNKMDSGQQEPERTGSDIQYGDAAFCPSATASEHPGHGPPQPCGC